MKRILASVFFASAIFSARADGALIPSVGAVQFDLYGVDYVGPDAGVVRHPDSSGPFPIGVFPNITESALMFDPSPFSLTTARGNATYTSTGTNELVLAEGQVVQPITAQTISILKIDTVTGFLSSGETAAHQTNLSYQFDINLYPVAPGDPQPFATFDTKLLYFINGVLLPDAGVLHYEQIGSTAGNQHVVVTGPDGTVFVPHLNDGDVLSIAGELVFTVSHGAFDQNLPEPTSMGILLIGSMSLLGRSRCRSKRCA